MQTNVYIDAFNLYFGALKGTPYMWLDLAEFSRRMLPKHEVHAVKVFAAQVKSRPADPRQPVRQQIYFRALRTLPNLEIILGHYLSHVVRMPLANPKAGGPRFAEVIKTEEKGSDVNLATHLLNDAYRGEYACAVVISNDSDLLEPMRILRSQLSKKVGLINPHKHTSQVLAKNADFIKQIRKGVLAACQFPPTLKDRQGTFHKPPTW